MFAPHALNVKTIPLFTYVLKSSLQSQNRLHQTPQNN